MIQITRDEAMAILEELAEKPYRQVHELVHVLVKRIQEHDLGAKPIYTGEHNG